MKEYKIYQDVPDSASLNFRKFLNEVEKRINDDEEIIERSKECNRKFYEELNKRMKTVDPEYIGANILSLIFRTPRYSYIKHLKFDGKEYEAEIDELGRTFSVYEV